MVLFLLHITILHHYYAQTLEEAVSLGVRILNSQSAVNSHCLHPDIIDDVGTESIAVITPDHVLSSQLIKKQPLSAPANITPSVLFFWISEKKGRQRFPPEEEPTPVQVCGASGQEEVTSKAAMTDPQPTTHLHGSKMTRHFTALTLLLHHPGS